MRRPLPSTLFPYTTLFRSVLDASRVPRVGGDRLRHVIVPKGHIVPVRGSEVALTGAMWPLGDRKSTRLNSSHANISYAVFCLKKKNAFLLLLSLECRNCLP